MSRFLFVSVPLTGHVNPIAAVARVLSARGHDVAWAGSERFLRPLVGSEALIHQIPLRLHRGGQAELGMAAAKARWEGYIVPHTKLTLRGVDQAAADFRPDVMVVDQHAVAGALVAHRHGLPWATVAPTSMELTRPYRTLPKVEAWLLGLLDRLWADAGLPGTPPHDLRFSPHLLIGFTGAALTGELPWPENAALVGPALEPRPADVDFPWDWLDPARKHLLVTVGTLSMDLAEDFYRRMVRALEPLEKQLQAIVVAPEYALPDPPAHIFVQSRVPMLDLMPRLDAVVSHSGLNTVCEALAHGLPLVIAPIKGDQPINAAQVAAAGAGVRVRFTRSGPEALREAALAVLDDPSYRAAAARVRDSFRAAGGAPAGAGLLEALAQAKGPRDASSQSTSPASGSGELEVVHEAVA